MRTNRARYGHSENATSAIKPRPHQQQCPSNIVECYKFNHSFDNVECCFDIAAVLCSVCFNFVEKTKFRSTLLPKPAGFGNNVERSFVLLTKSKQIEHVQFVSTLSKGRNFTILVRHCCRCGRGLTRQFLTEYFN